MSIKEVSRQALEDAMRTFDSEHRDTTDWLSWTDNRSHKYVIHWKDQTYPTKFVVSLATGQPTSEFSGGMGSGQAGSFAKQKGLDVRPLRIPNLVTAGAKTDLTVGPVRPTFRMDAGTRSVGVGMKVEVEKIGSLDIGFALPSFASLTPEYVLSLLLDMGLTFHIPSSLATVANDAPEGYSGSKSGSGGQSQGRKADNKRRDPEPPIGDYKPAWADRQNNGSFPGAGQVLQCQL